MGAWVTYGLGNESQNMPGFITICPTLGHGGANNWSSAFLPAIHQGTPIGHAGVAAKEATIPHLRNRHWHGDLLCVLILQGVQVDGWPVKLGDLSWCF